MPDDDVTEAIRLARVLIEKLDALSAQIDAVRAIIRDEVTPQTVATGLLVEGKMQ